MIYKHNGSIITDISGKWLTSGGTPVDPYNPLNLPPNTVRVRTSDGNVPKKYEGAYGARYDSATLVPGTSDVYDVFKSGTDFTRLLYRSENVIEVLGANTSGVTSMGTMFCECSSLQSVPLFNTTNVTATAWMFDGCRSLSTVPLFDTSNVTNMAGMFRNCTSLSTVPLFDTFKVTITASMFEGCTLLQSVPLYDTSSVTDIGFMFSGCTSLTNIPLFDTSNVGYMSYMFMDCTSVQSGALALYQQASTQANPPSRHDSTFYNCGSNTVTGAAELSQIPSDWKSRP